MSNHCQIIQNRSTKNYVKFWNCFLVFCAASPVNRRSVVSYRRNFAGRVKGWILSGCLAASLNLDAQTNVIIRVMAANLNGDSRNNDFTAPLHRSEKFRRGARHGANGFIKP